MYIEIGYCQIYIDSSFRRLKYQSNSERTLFKKRLPYLYIMWPFENKHNISFGLSASILRFIHWPKRTFVTLSIDSSGQVCLSYWQYRQCTLSIAKIPCLEENNDCFFFFFFFDAKCIRNCSRAAWLFWQEHWKLKDKRQKHHWVDE